MINQGFTFAIAPMIDWTDRHCRYFHRLLTKRAVLYTEMIVAEGILRGDRDYLLKFDQAEHPVALQLGGSDPGQLADAAQLAEQYGYDEINLNVGCPSDRVQSGTFGACLMKLPSLVADCVAAMRAAVTVPVTVKCRIGVDDQDPDVALVDFVDKVASAGCTTFIIHARKAWLKGLSPKENRTIPPLDYEVVARLKQDRPDLNIILNGGVQSIDEALPHLARFDGVMMGRAAYERPWQLARVDHAFFGTAEILQTRAQIVTAMMPYIDAHVAQGGRVAHITRHMLGLYHGIAGARRWRQILTIESAKSGADASVLRCGLEALGETAEA